MKFIVSADFRRLELIPQSVRPITAVFLQLLSTSCSAVALSYPLLYLVRTDRSGRDRGRGHQQDSVGGGNGARGRARRRFPLRAGPLILFLIGML